MARYNLVVRGFRSNGVAALAILVWAAGGCEVQTNLAEATGGAAGDTALAGSDGDWAGSAGTTAAGTGGSGGAGGSDNGFAGTSVNAGGDDGSGGTDSSSGGSNAGSGGSAGGECFDGTIESFCAEFDCPASLEEAIEAGSSSVCGFDGTTLDEGCGMASVRRSFGLSASSYTFEKSTGELLAASVTNDVPFGPCNTNSYRTGASIEDCNDTRCYLCQPQVGEDGLACRLDCDCESVETTADPCFGPETCECYCAQLEATAE